MKIRGSEKYCSFDFTLNRSIDELRRAGYKKLSINFSVDIKEVDDCYQYVYLLGKGACYADERLTASKSWQTYWLSAEIDLDNINSETLTIKVQAENKIFKDFYVGTVYVKATATV